MSKKKLKRKTKKNKLKFKLKKLQDKKNFQKLIWQWIDFQLQREKNKKPNVIPVPILGINQEQESLVR
jgi:hypothetical protein